MHCRDCFHSDVCGGSSGPYNDVSMCKQFIERRKVLCGPAFDVVEKELERLQTQINELKNKLQSCRYENKSLEREVELLRIIRQTLEMQSGMKFNI